MLVATTLAGACSGGSPGVDAGAVCDLSDRVRELSGSSGRVHLGEQTYGNGEVGSSVWIVFWTVPRHDAHYLEVAREGQCVFYRQREPSFCDPACDDFWSYCADGECVPYLRNRSAGTISLSGLRQPMTVECEDGEYGFGGEISEIDPGADLFLPGDTITVSASGEGGIPPFSVTVEGVSDMITDLCSNGEVYELIDGQDNLFSWTPQGDGSAIELVLQKGWHGAPGTHVIYCTADDAEGTISVPASMVALYPYYGPGELTQHHGIIRRVSRAFAETDCGPVEIMALSLRSFPLIHMQP